MLDKTTLINQTRKWLSDVIIAHRLCPFAKREHDNGRIHYEVIETADLESQLEHITAQFAALDADMSLLGVGGDSHSLALGVAAHFRV